MFGAVISKIGLFVGPSLFFLILYLPLDLSFSAKLVLCCTLWMGVWWITEAYTFVCYSITSIDNISNWRFAIIKHTYCIRL